MSSGEHGHAHGEAHEEHLSVYPILVGVGALLLYFGFATELPNFGPVLGIGLIVFLYAMLGWVREDVKFWRANKVEHGVLPGKDVDWYGMLFFLGTEITLFGGLFATFFVQRGNYPDVWHEAREHLAHALPLVSINTALLVSSSFTYHFAEKAIAKNNRKSFIGFLVVTLVLGAIFLVLQVNEYLGLIAAGITLGSGSFGSIFYLLTGTHGFHVFLGLVFIGTILVRALMGQFNEERHVMVESVGMYWHFVDVVWLLLYTIVYLGVI